ncbi:hypothetical protein NFI96_008185 [Prochilodus magdalenae]|nr:hypothetical protein NFI96_008185 [Prochilodus magdalenae]
MFPGETSAQTIDPLVGEVQLPEGDDLTLSCNYTTTDTNSVLQWYRQSLGSSPEFLLYISLYGAKSDPPPHMSAVVDKDLKRVDLKISSAAVSDSVLYYCALRPTVTGNPDTLYRNWFYDRDRAVLLSSNGSPQLVLMNWTSVQGHAELEFKEGFRADLDSISSLVPLTIQKLHVPDSAVYY